MNSNLFSWKKSKMATADTQEDLLAYLGLTKLQYSVTVEGNLTLFLQNRVLAFRMFSKDSKSMSEMEFLAFCKSLKIYPVSVIWRLNITLDSDLVR